MIKYVEKSSGLLFSTHDLHAIMGSQTAAMRAEVNAMDPNRLLNTSPADLAQYLAEKYRLRAPSLIRDAWSVAETETDDGMEARKRIPLRLPPSWRYEPGTHAHRSRIRRPRGSGQARLTDSGLVSPDPFDIRVIGIDAENRLHELRSDVHVVRRPERVEPDPRSEFRSEKRDTGFLNRVVVGPEEFGTYVPLEDGRRIARFEIDRIMDVVPIEKNRPEQFLN